MRFLSQFSLTVLVVALLATGTFTGCRETETFDLTGGTDTTSTTQLKNVLIEEMTGVRCVNCPEAHDLAKQIANANTGRVEIVSIHTGFYAVPYGASQHNFKIPQAGQIESYLGGPISYPIAAVDRVFLDGQTAILVDKSFWAGLVAQQLNDTLKVALDLATSYNATNNQLTVNLGLTYLYDVNAAQKITVYITETDITDLQETPSGIDTFYVHKNVMRAVLTDATGEAIAEPTVAGTQLQRTYSITIPGNWVAQNCRVVALVARETTDSKEVLQVVGKSLN